MFGVGGDRLGVVCVVGMVVVVVVVSAFLALVSGFGWVWWGVLVLVVAAGVAVFLLSRWEVD